MRSLGEGGEEKVVRKMLFSSVDNAPKGWEGVVAIRSL